MKKLILLLAVALPFVFLETRVEVLDNVIQDRGSQFVGEVYGDHTYGQTFVARHAGLDRIDILMLRPQGRDADDVLLKLREEPTGPQIVVAHADSPPLPGLVRYYSFRFPALPDSAGKSYYFGVEAPAARPGSAFAVWAKPEPIYADGVLYASGPITPGSLAFRTYYEESAITMAGQWLANLTNGSGRLAIGSLIALLLPGYFLVLVLLRGTRFDLAERLALSLGLSLAVVPVALLYSSMFKVPMNERRIGLVVILLLAALAAVKAGSMKSLATALRASSRFDWGVLRALYGSIVAKTAPNPTALGALAALLIFGAALYSRLMILPWLSVPLWTDSIHHSLITKLIVERGMIPDSLEPYYPLVTLTYHTGYHSFLAFFQWVTGAGVLPTVSIVGQLLNAASVLASYLFTVRLTRNRLAGILAGVITAFVSSMPFDYTGMSRYTQLAGHTMLPAASILALEALNTQRRQWGWMLASGIVAAGLFLVHVRVAMFYVLFVLIYASYRSWQERGRSGRLMETWLRVGAMGIIALVLVSPRLSYLSGNLVTALSSSPQVSDQQWKEIMRSYNAFGDVPLWWGGWPIVALSAAAAVWVCIWRHMPSILVLMWTASLFLLAGVTTGALSMPALNNFAVLIALYVPSSIVGGYFLADLYRLLRGRFQWVLPIAVAVVSVAVVWGIRSQLAGVDSGAVLVTTNDERALDWIKGNVSEQAVFLVNASPSGSFAIFFGTDAGWWLPLLTRSASVLPPMLYGSEKAEQGSYATSLNKWYTELLPLIGTGRELDLLRQRGVSNVFVGEKGGPIDIAKLEASRNYRVVFRSGSARVFAVVYD